MKIILSVIVLFIVVIFLIYGTLSPCGILKKEIANEARKSGGQGLYVLFGGFIERGIDTFNPAQCLSGIYRIKTQGVDVALENLLQ